MNVKMDPHSLAPDVAKAASVPVATDGRAEQAGRRTTESIVQAEFGNQKQSATTGTYAEEALRQLGIKEINSDLDVMDPSNFISRCMTGEDARDLSEEKTPLEEYTDTSLERALTRVKEQRRSEQDSMARESEKIREIEEEIREKSEEIAADQRLLSEMSQVLAHSELPLSGHIDDLKKALDMTASVQFFGDAALRYMVGEDTVSPKSIKDSLYGSGQAMVGRRDGADVVTEALAVPDESGKDGFDEVRSLIEDRLAEDGAADEEMLKKARWLYQNDLPVTGENLTKIDTVLSLREMDTGTLLERLVSEMEDGVLAEEADLSHLSREEVRGLVERLTGSGEDEIQKAYQTNVSRATARRQLEEIRLTMTISSAREMTKLGVTIDIFHLEEIVDGLRAEEARAQEALFEETLLTATEENKTIFSGTINAARTVQAAPVELLSYTFESRQSITLQGLADQGQVLAGAYETAGVQRDIYLKMEQTYEAVGTEVRSDLGDSIRKAFSHMGPMLDELGLPRTAENERAVRILGYNQMEITAESVTEMKTWDRRVNNLMDAMKPQVVKRMIEEKINPLNLSLSELEETVGKIYDEVHTEDITFSRFLWKLDKQQAISQEERESLIGVYRLLDKIEKSDGAVIGQLLNEGRDLSLKNLLEATRTRRKGHVDAEVSDESGSVQAHRTGKGIDAQILSAFMTSEMPELKKVLSPKAMLEKEDWEDMTPEELLTLCEEEGETDSEMAAYHEEVAERVRQALSDPTGELFFNETTIPHTARNILSAGDFVRRQMTGVRDLWQENESDDIVEYFDDPDELENIYEDIEKTHLEALEELRQSDDISYDRIGELARMAGHISFYRSIRSYQMFEVPLMTERGVLDCQVTIRDGAASERGTVEITVDSEEMGRLRATFRLSGMKVNGFVTAEQQESIESYQSMLEDFEKDLEGIGFTMDGNRLLQGNRNSLQIGDATDGAKNQDLYRIAKCFLRHIMR